MLDEQEYHRGRQTVIMVMLPGVLVLAVLGLVLAFCGGLALQSILAVLVCIVAVGTLHYWLWGRRLDQEVAGEREEEEIRQKMAEEVNDDEVEL